MQTLGYIPDQEVRAEEGTRGASGRKAPSGQDRTTETRRPFQARKERGMAVPYEDAVAGYDPQKEPTFESRIEL